MNNTFKKCIVFLMLALGLSTQFFANQSLSTANDDHYYIQAGGVYLAPNGIYASIDGELIQINTLCADEKGIYVPYGEIVGRLVKCPFCGRWYDSERGHPNCPGFPG